MSEHLNENESPDFSGDLFQDMPKKIRTPELVEPPNTAVEAVEAFYQIIEDSHHAHDYVSAWVYHMEFLNPEGNRWMAYIQTTDSKLEKTRFSVYKNDGKYYLLKRMREEGNNAVADR